ncbi:MAG: hypothetical protein ABSC50_09375 [Candidatus Bathyarchaeia archaeon]
MSKREYETEQEARIALLDHLGSQLRYWGSSLVALAVGFFAAVQVRQELMSVGLFELTIVALLVQSLCSVLRMLWLGGLADRVLYAALSESVTRPVLFRVSRGTQDCFRNRWPGKVLNRLSTFPGYALFFLVMTTCIWIVTLRFGSELVLVWLSIVSFLKGMAPAAWGRLLHVIGLAGSILEQ